MDTEGKVSVLWRQGFSLSSGVGLKEGIPRKLINELKHQTGLEVIFKPAESTFLLLQVVVPSDGARSVAKSTGLMGNMFSGM